MNFVALIGVVEGVEISGETIAFGLKVEKDSDTHAYMYEKIPIVVHKNDITTNEIEKLDDGAIIGIKGKVAYHENNFIIHSERLQIF